VPYRSGPTTPRNVVQRRSPFELWIVIACTFVGLLALMPFGGERNGVVDRYLPALALPWYIGLLIGGLVTSFALLRRARTVRILMFNLALERVGLIILCGLTAGYGAALMLTVVRGATGPLLLGLSIAAAMRVHQITRELRGIETIVDNARLDGDTT